MLPPLRVLLVAVLTLSMGLAGCIGKDEPIDAGTVDNESNESVQPETLPDGREFVAVEETNKTEEGVGGIDHKHDYWHGEEQIVIFDRDVYPEGSVFERGDNSHVFIYYVNLPENISESDQRSALVYEGTGKVIFELTSGPPTATELQMSFRTAAKDWTPYAPIAPATPFEYLPEKIETDMPHSFRSLWNWKLQAVAPVPVGDPVGWTTGEDVTGGAVPPLHVKITVVKARSVDDWPGHPAFYDGVEERVVIQNKAGKTTVDQAADVLIYGVEPDQIVPDKLISMGTRYLDVYVNITKLELPPGVESDGFTMFWRSASTQPSDLGYNPGNNETDGKTWAFWHLEVSPDELDSPYQPTSRFSFKVLANPANDDLARCYRCVPYTIEYTMTIIARPDPAAAAAALDEPSAG